MSRLLLLMGCLLVAMAQGHAQERAWPPPWGAAIALRQAQDDIVNGRAGAAAEQRALVDGLGKAIAEATESAWVDTRNRRAVALYLVSGGATQPVKGLLASTADFGAFRPAIEAMVAFADRRTDAAGLLAKVDIRPVEAMIGAELALAQGMTSADPVAARAAYAHARLLAPGTMIEEAAMRREIGTLLADKQIMATLVEAARYSWRFPRSVYAADVIARVAATALPDPALSDRERVAVKELLDALPDGPRRTLLLSIGRSSVLDGRLAVAGFVGDALRQSAAATPMERATAELYGIVSRAFSGDEAASAGRLATIDLQRLDDGDRAVADATLVMLERVTAQPLAAPDAFAPLDADRQIKAAVGAALARADASIAEATP